MSGPKLRRRKGPNGPTTKQKQRGGTGKLKPIDLNTIKDKTLEGIERRIRNLDHEELFIFDKDDKLVAAYMGGPTSVAFPMMELFRDGATVTHGHPVGDAEFGGTLSFADVENMLNSNWKEHRATASGQGEMNYIMRRTANSDDSGPISQINKDIRGGLQDRWVDTYRSEYKKALNEGKTEKQAQHIARQKGVGIIHKYYSETFPKFGFEYVTRKDEYRYGR